MNEKGQLVLKVWAMAYVPRTATRVIGDGKGVNARVNFFEQVSGYQDSVYDAKGVQLLGSDGKTLDPKMLPTLLKEERPVLYMYRTGLGKIDPVFLKVIKKGTPILLLPVPTPPPHTSLPAVR